MLNRMAVAAPNRSATRGRLTRDQVLRAGIAFVDRAGLDALSMHKLGAELGVKAMSLYHHVSNKDDLLAGMTDLMWSEIPRPEPGRGWQEHARTLVAQLRAVVAAHPNAAPLLVSGQAMPEAALRLAEAYRHALTDAGLPDQHAVPFLRTVISYALGQSLAELSWTPSEADVASLLPAGASPDLAPIAHWLCADCVMSEQLDLGITLMIRGLQAQLDAAQLSRPG
jgi:AcrR family transcriptional regulator